MKRGGEEREAKKQDKIICFKSHKKVLKEPEIRLISYLPIQCFVYRGTQAWLLCCSNTPLIVHFKADIKIFSATLHGPIKRNLSAWM